MLFSPSKCIRLLWTVLSHERSGPIGCANFTIDSIIGRTFVSCTMLPSFRVMSAAGKTFAPISLTFFTKETCQLCTNAHKVLDQCLTAENLPQVHLSIVDIMKPENSEAFDKYCFDVPVLHMVREGQSKPVKFMHYFHEDKLLEEFRR